MRKSEKRIVEELSIDDRLDQIIDSKKNENSALKKIAFSLRNNEYPKNKKSKK
ncbi:MAG: hypothetical protein L3J31_02860 [Bacteroidales bacterium]|nr:hypothetical protein [Bacteroidales bacterium]